MFITAPYHAVISGSSFQLAAIIYIARVRKYPTKETANVKFSGGSDDIFNRICLVIEALASYSSGENFSSGYPVEVINMQ